MAADLAGALRRMERLTNYERGRRPAEWKVGTASVRSLLGHLHEPHRALAMSIHVTGSKGKGTVAALSAVGLVRAGLRVGVFLSPHVYRINERVSVDLQPVDDVTLGSALHAALDAQAAATDDDPAASATWFDVLTAGAFRVFADLRADCAVVECGMGGRRDSTNVVESPVCILTNVFEEHMRELGGSREAIAREKAAIVHPGASLVTGLDPSHRDTDPAVAAAFEEATRRGAARIICRPGPAPRPGAGPGVEEVMRGNEAMALAAIQELARRGLVQSPLLRPAQRTLFGGWKDAAAAILPGRLEERRLPSGARLLYDGGHVAESARLAGEAAASAGDDAVVIVVGLASDKTVSAFLGALATSTRPELVIATELGASTAAHEAAHIADEAARAFEGVEVVAVRDPSLALNKALSWAAGRAPRATVLVTGSMKLGAVVGPRSR